MEYQKHRLAIFCSCLILNILLVLGKELGMQLHISRLIDAMDVPKTGSNGKVGANGRECLVNIVDVFGLSV